MADLSSQETATLPAVSAFRRRLADGGDPKTQVLRSRPATARPSPAGGRRPPPLIRHRRYRGASPARVVTSTLTGFFVTCQDGDVFTFVGGRPALDLTGTVMYRHRHAPIELLAGPADVSEWARQAGLVHEPVAVSPSGLTRTRELREAIYTLLLGRICHRPDSQADIHLLNAAAASPPLGLALDQGVLRRSGNLTQLHSVLARDALEILGSPLINRVKECAGEDCTRLYLDISRNATRRWCGMRQCGDKVKSAHYRARRRAPRPVRDVTR